MVFNQYHSWDLGHMETSFFALKMSRESVSEKHDEVSLKSQWSFAVNICNFEASCISAVFVWCLQWYNFSKQNVFYIRNVRQGMGKTLTGTLTFSAMASLAWRRNEYENVLLREFTTPVNQHQQRACHEILKKLKKISLSKVQSNTFYHA